MNLYSSYDFVFSEEAMRRLFKKKGKPVRHQQTCPVCGRKLVNTYRRGDVWKCKKCWDAAGKEVAGDG